MLLRGRGGGEFGGGVSRIFVGHFQQMIVFLSLSPFDWHPCWVI
jgi:hypothetical protein